MTSAVQAQDVMTSPVGTVSAGAPVKEAAKRMIEHNVSALPVVDGKNRVAGIVSEGDLIRRAEIGTEARGARVRDVMTQPVVSVRRTTPLREVARVLEKSDQARASP